jgi:CHAT domain-containing protein/tetratricopeptide (TPR) repeat protein
LIAIARPATWLILAALASPALLSGLIAQQPGATAQAAIEGTIQTFFTTLASTPAETTTGMWSAQAQDAQAQEQLLRQRLPAANTPLPPMSFSRPAVGEQQATLRVTLARSDDAPPDPARVRTHEVFDVSLIHDDGTWKILRAESAFDRLAAALAKAPQTERDGLLAAEPGLRTPTLVSALNDLGDRELRREQYAAAGDAFRAAAEVADALHDGKGEARALVNTGRLLLGQFELERARDYLQRGLDASQNGGDDATAALAMTTLGVIAHRQGNLDEAEKLYRASLAMHQRLGDEIGRATNLHNLGLLSSRRGRRSEAMAFYRQSLDIRTAQKDVAGTAGTLNNLGIVHRDQGNYAPALDYFTRSLAVSEAIGRPNDAALTVMNIGGIHWRQGNHAQAQAFYAKALERFEATGNRDGTGRVLISLGALYDEQGDSTRAMVYYQRALGIAEALKDRAGIASLLINMGALHGDRKEDTEAADYYDKGRSLFEELGMSGNVAEALYGLAGIRERQGQYTVALELAERAKALAVESESDETLWEAQFVAARIHRAMNQPAKARAELEQAIALVEDLRKRVAGAQDAQQLYLESRLDPYHLLTELLLEQHLPAEALLVAERAKARALLDVATSGPVDTSTVMTATERQQESTLTDRLVALNNERFKERLRSVQDPSRLQDVAGRLERARLELEAFHTTLYSTHPELRLRRAETPPLSLDEVRTVLPDEKTVVLEYLATEEATFLFVVRRSRPDEPWPETASPVRISSYRVPMADKDLAARIERFRGMLASVDNRYGRSARELYDLLIAPAAGELRRGDRLVIVPDGPLWELPFQVLQTPRSQDLIDRHAMFFAPSLSVLRESMKRRTLHAGTSSTAPPTLLAMGNPTLGGESVARVQALMDERLESLPEAERQVRALERIYGSARSDVYVGDQAREERLKAAARSYRVLHVATHGILNDRNPMYSHLVMSQQKGGTEDGLLEAREIMQMEMTADVAVLSACETARGRVGGGEGMIGLTWALLVAGVPTTVVSQWKVRSDSTAELMIAFHRRLKDQLARPAGQRDIAGALRMAALEIKRDPRYRHPFHWAPFVVVGHGY